MVSGALKLFRSRFLVAAALAAGAMFAVTAPTPAQAGGYGYYGYHAGYKHGYYGRRHYRHRHYRRHHGGGGKAAAIALGVIGGAIILNELAEDRARQRAYDERYYRSRPYYGGGYYSDRGYGGGYGRGYEQGFERGFERGLDEGALAPGSPAPPRAPARPLETLPSAPSGGDDLDAVLDGGPNEAGRISVAEAYQTCLRRVRSALSERGFILSAPFEPDTADDLGGAYRMTATVMAQRGSDDWSRAMTCEADEGRVYMVELI